MTSAQITAQRIGLLELRLLLSPFLSSADCATVMEMAKLARECVGQPEPPAPKRVEPFSYLQPTAP